MQQLKVLLSRLKNPSVFLSIVSQTVIVSAFYKIAHNQNIFVKIVIGVCAGFVLLGILSDPTTGNFGYGEDMLNCRVCKKNTPHVKICDDFVCKICAHRFNEKI